MKSAAVVVLVALGCSILIAPRVAHAQTPAPPAPGPGVTSAPRTGMILVARGMDEGGAWAAHAIFTRGSVWGTVLGADGPCTVYSGDPAVGLSAGAIRVAVTRAPMVLEPAPAPGGDRYRPSTWAQASGFDEGATITVEASGGADLPAFHGSVAAPSRLAGYTPPRSVSRAGTTLGWTPGRGPEILIFLGAYDLRSNEKGVAVVCRVADTGTFTIPASTFRWIPASHRAAILFVGRLAEAVQTVADARVTIDAVDFIAAGPIPLLEGSARSAGECERRRAPRDCPPPVHRFLGMGWGTGGWSRLGDVAPSGAGVYTFRLGQRLRTRLHLVEEIDLTDSGSYSADPAGRESHGAFLLGVRWAPFERYRCFGFPLRFFPGRCMDFLAFYVKASVGAAFRERYTPTSDVTSWAPVASAALGYLPFQGREWALGYELREQFFHDHEGLQRDWASMLLLQVSD